MLKKDNKRHNFELLACLVDILVLLPDLLSMSSLLGQWERFPDTLFSLYGPQNPVILQNIHKNI